MRFASVLLLIAACHRPTTDDAPADDSPAEESKPPDDSASDDSASDDSHADDSATDDSGSDDSGLDTSVPEEPRYVILFIGDGMGFEHVEGAGMYGYGAPGSLSFEAFPHQGRLRTASYSGITDSAASATAYASGYKTYNTRLGLDVDGQSVVNLVERARAHGMSVGIVTTDKLTGATPSGFVVHVEDRGDDAEIAASYLTDLPDVALAGGYDAFAESLSTLDVNLATTGTELAALHPDGRKLLGLFAHGTFPFVADGYNADEPTLATMTSAALDFLDENPNGFFLMVESARIDHASHGNREEEVFDEVMALDAAVSVAADFAQTHDATVVVTADHECGGLDVTGSSGQGEIPASTWRWGRHTNADVPVYGLGPYTDVLDGVRQDQLWVNAVLTAAVDGRDSVQSPSVPALIDGSTAELGPALVTQPWSTNFGAGYNQLDALHLSADRFGLRIGVDGVFERDDNGIFALIDLDYGGNSGFGAGVSLSDITGRLDAALSGMNLAVDVPGVGFDIAYGSLGAQETEYPMLIDDSGVRGWGGDLGTPTNFSWWQGVSNFDDGNVAVGAAARDAGSTGQTENGYEMLVPWTSAFRTGIPSAGATIAVAVVLVNQGGDFASNQALPPLASGVDVGSAALTIVQVAVITIDAAGNPVGSATLVP